LAGWIEDAVMKRFGLAVVAVALLVSVMGLAVGQRGDDARAQGTKAPILVMEVASWATGDADPTAWQWQALESGSLHVAFWTPGKLACAKVALPAGITATYADADGKTATAAGPADAAEMCEAVFSRANG
jgi:hypothetical protein